jgi:c-di-GMP-binding flagellar brake protein YcgR
MSSMPGKAMNQAQGRLRRRHARYRCEFPVLVNLLSDRERQQLNGHCRDVSEAGIGVLIAGELPLGEVATLTFSLPGVPQPWDVRAVLRHRRGYHYGFEFLSLTDRQAKTLNGYLKDLERADREE